MRLDGGRQEGAGGRGVQGSLSPCPPSLLALGTSFCALLVAPQLGGVGASQH